MVPFLLLSASSILAAEITNIFQINVGVLTPGNAQLLASAINQCFSPIMLISLAYHLAKRLNTHVFLSVTQVLLVYITVQMLGNLDAPFARIFTSQLSMLVMTLPFICIPLQTKLAKHTNLYLRGSYDKALNEVFGLLPAYLMTYAVVMLLFFFALMVEASILYAVPVKALALGDQALLVIRTASNSILWFLGLHGTYTFDVLFGNEFLKHPLFPNLSYRQFYDLFVVFGGAGATTSLIVAIFFCKQNDADRRIAKLALPFAIFNINEILIFGLPIIYNRYLAIPFIAVPLVNLGIAYGYFSLFPTEFTLQAYPWITPVLFNAYAATGGNLGAIALQFFLIALGAVIYFPFVRKYAAEQSSSEQTRLLAQKLNIADTHELFGAIDAADGVSAYQAQFEIIQANHELQNIIKLLSTNNLHVYYQPKANVVHCTCKSFEALLRLEQPDGKVVGPYFLSHIENSGLAPIIDLWVCRRVALNLKQWHADGYSPNISINLHPDTLNNTAVVEEICAALSGQDVDFEIIERSLLQGAAAQTSLQRLRQGNFTLSIDDFGVGYSSLSTLINANHSYLKIDISLTKLITTKQGYEVNKGIVNLCHQVGVIAISEGVETREQFELVREIGIQHVQGYYLSPAVEFAKVRGLEAILKPKLI